MKKTILHILLCTLLTGLLSVTAFAKSGLRVSTESLLVETGGTATFSVIADDAAGRIDLSVSDPELVSLSEKTSWLNRSQADYTVTGLKSGRCTVTITYTDVATYQETVVTGSATVEICVPCDRHTYPADGGHQCTVCGWEAVSVDGLDVRPAYLYGLYTGGKISPSVTVKDGDNTLVRGKDYTVEYLNNVQIGVATARVTGVNDYFGSKDVLFEIRPANVTTIRVAATEKDKITLTWTPSAGSDGYTVFQVRDGRLFEVGTTHEARYVVTGLTENQEYQFRIRPFATVEDTAQRLDATFDPTYWSTRYSSVVTAVAKDTSNPGTGAAGGSSSGTTDTVKNPDGSTTTTVTDKTTGAVTETTTKTETAADGTKTETKTETVTAKDGTVTSTETVKATDTTGTTATKVTETNAAGETTTTVESKVTTKAVTEAAKSGTAVTLPVEVEATTAAASAPVVKIDLPASVSTAKVEVPVSNVTPGTVAVIVKADGTEQIVKTSIVTDNGVALNVAGDVEIKLVDNSIDFTDSKTHWARDEISFATSRELFKGTSDTAFTPEGTVTRAMLFTVMARFDDADVVTTGANWYADSLEWAKANGVSDGTNPTGNITREQLATMLYRYVGEPAVAGSTDSYVDAGSVSDYAAAAMQWAVENGLINGINGRLQPQGYATRAQLAAIMQRFCANVMF